MASITDCVVEGLKYLFNDIKRLLGFGVLFALMSAISTFISVKSLDIFKTTVDIVEKTNATVTHMSFSQLPSGDIYMMVALAIVGFIIALFIMGYQYDIVKLSIAKKDELPGFGNISGMLINGIKYFFVALAYNIVPILVLVIGIVAVGESSALPVFAIISVLLFIIAFFLLIKALNNMIAHDSLKKAFDLRQIIDNISNLGWGKYIGIVLFTIIVYMIIMVAVSFILSILTAIFAVSISNVLIVSVIIAIIEGLFIDSYGSLFYNRVAGSIYREAIK